MPIRLGQTYQMVANLIKAAMKPNQLIIVYGYTHHINDNTRKMLLQALSRAPAGCRVSLTCSREVQLENGTIFRFASYLDPTRNEMERGMGEPQRVYDHTVLDHLKMETECVMRCNAEFEVRHHD